MSLGAARSGPADCANSRYDKSEDRRQRQAEPRSRAAPGRAGWRRPQWCRSLRDRSRWDPAGRAGRSAARHRGAPGEPFGDASEGLWFACTDFLSLMSANTGLGPSDTNPTTLQSDARNSTAEARGQARGPPPAVDPGSVPRPPHAGPPRRGLREGAARVRRSADAGAPRSARKQRRAGRRAGTGSAGLGPQGAPCSAAPGAYL